MQTRRLILSISLAAMWQAVGTPAEKFDVVVYGGTSAGVTAAVAAAREGASVALLEPGKHLGGMTSGGLGATDYGRQNTIGGLSREFYQRLGKHYGEPISWRFEPHVAEQVYNEMVKEAGVRLLLGHRLKEKGGVRKKGARITGLVTENGAVIEAAVFIDCTYEGDLMAFGGVSFVWGRESAAQYGEPFAGVRTVDKYHYHIFPPGVSAYGPGNKLLPEISADPRGEIGAGDKKVQAYNFRLCLTDDKSNQVPFVKPPGYDAGRYALLARMLAALTSQNGRPPKMNELMIVSAMPKRKTDINNRGGFSTDYIGKNWDYPTASYKRRAEIWRDHVLYTQGFFYFLVNDPQVPEPLRSEMGQWGLAKDEFTDNGNWPHQLYIREARRMLGDFVMTQKDAQTDLVKPDSVAMGSYQIDSHNIQRHVTPEGFVQNEGDTEVPSKPYQIAYRVMLPKASEAVNLLVPVAASTSHIAYGTLRMEPVFMALGHAAGVAARMASQAGKAVQEVDTATLRQKLKTQGAVLELAPGAEPYPRVSREVFQARLPFFAHEPAIPLEARVVGMQERPEAIREKIAFRGAQGFLVPGYLELPKQRTERHPLVLLLHGWSGSKEAWHVDGNIHSGGFMRRALIEAGYAILALDAATHGERTGEIDYQLVNAFDDPKAPPRRNYFTFAEISIQTVKDYRRALDYLAQRKDIDMERIGLVGYSMGGMDAFYLLSVEPRVRAAVACVPPLLNPNYGPASPIDYTWGIGQKPFLMLMGRRDEMYEAARVDASFHDYLEGPNTKLIWYDQGHKLTEVYVPDALAWIQKHLTRDPASR